MHPGSIPGQASIAILVGSPTDQIGAVIQPIAPAAPTLAATTATATTIRALRPMKLNKPPMSSSRIFIATRKPPFIKVGEALMR